MRKTLSLLVLTFIALWAMAANAPVVQAATPLPPSAWYAVVWNRSDDTLHWVNNATELASTPRPKLPGEAAAGLPGLDTRVHISPNGRYLMQTALLENQRHGLGFYDLENGVWLQTHEALPGEFFIRTGRNPFSQNSELAAIGLASGESWRVLAFETATGNVIGQLTPDNPGIPANYIPAQRAPSVAFIHLDEGLGQWRVHVRFIQPGPGNEPIPQPAVMWTPGLDVVAPSDLPALLMDFDVLSIQGRVLSSVVDANSPTETRIQAQMLGHTSEVVYEQADAFVNQPRWVAGGLFVAFWMNTDQQVPMWHLGAYGSNNFTPFAPDYDELLGTLDGFILVDYHGGEVRFANTLAFQPYTPTVGSVIYTTDKPGLEVVYVTPMGTQFTLASLATPPDDPVVVDGPADVQAPPQTCGSAPAPRLTIGEGAQVTFTTGVPLNVRTAAAGDLIMQIAEGTIVEVVGGPTCADEYLWWQIQFESGGATVGGWSAEGDNSNYYLEPVAVMQVSPGIVPATPLAVAPIPIVPTQAPLVVQPPVQPTPAPPLSIAVGTGDGNCANAPADVTLSAGILAHMQVSGTLAMRTNLTDPYPSHSIPTNVTVNVMNGPVCHGGFRMWYVSTTLNGAPVQGWVPDGFGGNRYLYPGAA